MLVVHTLIPALRRKAAPSEFQRNLVLKERKKEEEEKKRGGERETAAIIREAGVVVHTF